MDQFSSGLSEQQLKYGYWYATHQLLVRRIVLLLAWVIMVGMGMFVVWNMVDWAVVGGVRERTAVVSMIENTTDFASAFAALKPRDLAVSNTLALPAGEGKVDFVSTVKNVNTEWAMVLTYSFVYGSAETASAQSFVLPNEEVLLPVYGVSADAGVQPTFRAKEMRWLRVMPHSVGRYAPYAAARLRFDVGVPQTSFVEIGARRITKTVFTVTNRSAFGYWQVPLIVSLENQGVVSAVQTVVLDALKPGEVRDVEASWFYDVPSAATPRVVPHVNILDSRVYMPL